MDRTEGVGLHLPLLDVQLCSFWLWLKASCVSPPSDIRGQAVMSHAARWEHAVFLSYL